MSYGSPPPIGPLASRRTSTASAMPLRRHAAGNALKIGHDVVAIFKLL
jgi:hypothetical protein